MPYWNFNGPRKKHTARLRTCGLFRSSLWTLEMLFFSWSSRSIACTRSDHCGRCLAALVWIDLDIYSSFRTATHSSSRHALSSVDKTTDESQSHHCRSSNEWYGHSFKAASHNCLYSDNSGTSSINRGVWSQREKVLVGNTLVGARSSGTFIRFEYVIDEISGERRSLSRSANDFNWRSTTPTRSTSKKCGQHRSHTLQYILFNKWRF